MRVPKPGKMCVDGISRRRVVQGMLGVVSLSGLQLNSAVDAAMAGATHQETDLVDLVNVMQGTYSTWRFSHGNTLPLISCPFGMSNWTPQNSTGDGWFFDPTLLTMQGVRATHQPSPWMGDYGHCTVMAQAGDRVLRPKDRAAAYKTDNFHVSPDYLSVLFERDGVQLEAAPTERCAIFRFTFPAGKNGRFIIDTQSHIQIEPDGHTITGYSNMGYAASNKAACFFVAICEEPFVSASPFKAGAALNNQTTADGPGIGAVAEFGAVPHAIVRVGTSFISVEQARFNLAHELGSRPFDVVRAATRKLWNDTLGVVQLTGGTEKQRRTFYSCLYRTNLYPRMFHEPSTDGKSVYYSPFDGKIHHGVMYTDTGLWDGYHTLYPLLSLLQPERLGEMVQGFINAYHEGGWLPQWPHPGYHGTMGGTHSDVVITDALLKNIPGFDRQGAFDAMWKDATVPANGHGDGRGDLSDYIANGYLPHGKAGAVVSNTLDYAYDDACIALAAQRLGHTVQQKVLTKRALNYRAIYDPVTGFMRPKNADGTWVEPFDQYAWGDAYTEGGPWQWSLSVPHDPAGLMKLMGGSTALVRKLDRLFWQKPVFHVGGYGGVIHEMAEMAAVPFGQYDQGNQPGHQVLPHYIATGCPSRLQYWSRRVLNDLYSPDGYPGDEDNGEMAAWYVLAALGVFPHCPGRPSYVFTSPLFPKAVVSLKGGRKLVITAPGTSESAVYVRQVKINSHAQSRFWISHEELAKGGNVEFIMAERPEKRRLNAMDLPPSLSTYSSPPDWTDAVPLRVAINCGGVELGDYVADVYSTGGDAENLTPSPTKVGDTQRQGDFQYRIPLPMPVVGESYTLNLHFAPSTTDGTMDVHVNGVSVLSNYRPPSAGGVVVHSISGLLPTGGFLTIAFASSANIPPDSSSRVSAIEVIATPKPLK